MIRLIPHSALFILLIFAAVNHMARGQSLQPLARPNHYIILIDASSSTVETAERGRRYKGVLGEQLLKRLYYEGFGDSVPAYEPRLDRLTLLHFGVVTGDSNTAYLRLREHNLLSDFIHPSFVRKEGISEADLKTRLFPAQTYNYTILTWAKQLALHSSRPESPKSVSHRTFMVMVHDGRSNEHSSQGEVDMVRRWSGAGYGKVEPIVSSIDRDYQFSDGRGARKPAWTEEFHGGGNGSLPFFIETYEVTSAARAKWEADGERLRPLDDLRFGWIRESGDSPQGELTATPSEEFTAWLNSADNSELSLTAGPDALSGAEPGLKKTLVFQQALSCEPLSFDASLNAMIERSDPLLGARTVRYTHRRRITAPAPIRCTAAFAVSMGGIGLIVALALAAIALYLYYRFRTTQIEIHIPGILKPIRLGRRGRREGRAPVTPRLGIEALSLKLPGRLSQWLFYRGAFVTLSFDVDDEPLNWSDRNNPIQIRLPHPHSHVLAQWRDLPAAPTTVTLAFRQGSQRADVRLTYPPALAKASTRTDVMDEYSGINENTVFVALDLGSESMAAYYEGANGKGGMIDMQAQAERLSGLETQELDLLMDGEGDDQKRSPRLWNRIALNDWRSPLVLGDDHATLYFADSPDKYNQSLFKFFHGKNGWPPAAASVMPNPKILFHQQVDDILKFIKNGSMNGAGLNPELLIQHLTMQVLTNFVLASPELQGYDRNDIHLTITVPNIYSLLHAENIRKFVEKNAKIRAVEVLSESDAVAYYALKTIDGNESEEVKRFKDEWSKELKDRGKLCLVTIDVGKGTTDLSCILVENPPPAGVSGRWFNRSETNTPDNPEEPRLRRYSVQGKTGKSSGGNYLNYIFASYYDKCLKEAAEKILSASLPFGFVQRAIAHIHVQSQRQAVSELEKLIELIKRNMTEDYEIVLTPDKQITMLTRVVDKIFAGLTSDERSRYGVFKSKLIQALTLPRKLELTGFEALAAWCKKAFERSKEKDTDGVAPSPLTVELKREIEKYVDENASELMESLKSLVKEHQTGSSDKGGIDGDTFVVVSGQASQFKPLRKAIDNKCEAMGIKENQRLKIDGVLSKEACCMGVVNFWRANMMRANPKKLHGAYGCMEHFDPRNFKAFDMNAINNGKVSELNFDFNGMYMIVFTPRSSEEVEERPPQLNDGATARIKDFMNKRKFEMKYDSTNLELIVNENRLTIAGFGSADSSIYKKVWPEILEPTKE